MSSPTKLKIAFLITAYNDFEQLNIFIKQLLRYEGSYIYIHIDQKSPLDLSVITKDKRVTIIPKRISVEWGDSSQAESILELFKFAVNTGIDFDYASLHSGSDMAIKPIGDFATFLSSDNARAYLDCNKLPAKNWGHGGGLERITLYYPRAFRKKMSSNSPLRYARSIYQILYEKGLIKGRLLPKDIDFYGGSDWFTIDFKMVRESIEYLGNHPEYTKIFKDSLVGNEIFFVTMFTRLGKNSKLVLDNNLRYTDWNHNNRSEAGAPKTLTAEDLPNLQKSSRFFARKFNSRVDQLAIDSLKDI